MLNFFDDCVGITTTLGGESDMEIIKEFCPESGMVVLRTKDFNQTLAHFVWLFQEAQKDFPSLAVTDVEVVKFGGERYPRTCGLEFEVGDRKVPETYTKISELEPVY